VDLDKVLVDLGPRDKTCYTMWTMKIEGGVSSGGPSGERARSRPPDALGCELRIRRPKAT